MPHAAVATPPFRLAGWCYLTVIACGAFTEIVVRQSVIVADDVMGTASALAEHDTLWRWGIAVHVLYLVVAALVNLLLFDIFKAGTGALPRFMLILGLLSVAIEASMLTLLATPLVLADEGAAFEIVSAHDKAAWSYLAVQLYGAGWALGLIFFGTFCALLGVLILRTRRVPRALGVLMLMAGACYVASSLLAFLSPDVLARLIPWILLPSLIGELSLAVNLAIRAPRPAHSA
ncbi:DUF4386 domain-containing protein [Nocardioides cavernae]|uniref:DUF4386 domain-containing protein n=1 Tax=Nocardioides cavernae TaxID=1921566 RepID=A0ABR8N499_9ACTN|nr:DUF4386 domain-containing protein [Nocardioides cavernae]MBD3922988.1 DUF4386 domain-containing protein [Nocardioides cavernae]MBM7512092.1 ABC-type multidrug transport system permease subunit [Nocardioides cavernae]